MRPPLAATAPPAALCSAPLNAVGAAEKVGSAGRLVLLSVQDYCLAGKQEPDQRDLRCALGPLLPSRSFLELPGRFHLAVE